jgi:hypothetical protein
MVNGWAYLRHRVSGLRSAGDARGGGHRASIPEMIARLVEEESAVHMVGDEVLMQVPRKQSGVEAPVTAECLQSGDWPTTAGQVHPERMGIGWWVTSFGPPLPGRQLTRPSAMTGFLSGIPGIDGSAIRDRHAGSRGGLCPGCRSASSSLPGARAPSAFPR